jgi:hypothetical protein
MTRIFLDLETTPDMRPGAREAFIEDAINNIRAPSDMTKERALDELGVTDASERKYTSKDAALSRWCERFGAEKAEEIGDAAWRKTSFDATRGQICCIGFALDDGPTISYEGSERSVLGSFYSHLTDAFDPRRRPYFIGHNHVAFDLPFLFRRSVILGIEPPKWIPSIPKAWDESVFDTMVQWAGHGNRISMDDLCQALSIPVKDGMDGSMVCDAYMQGRILEIAEYCRQDVERTRAIYRRMTFYQEPAASPEIDPAELVPPWERKSA